MESADVTELKRHFGVLLEGMDSRIRQVADGVLGVRQELATFRGEVRAEFEETRAMIRLSYK